MTAHIVHRRKVKPEIEAAPNTWQRSTEHAGTHPPRGVTRLIIGMGNGKARLERGAMCRETTLKYPERWEAVVRFYLCAFDYHLVSEGSARIILERKEMP